MKVALVNPCWSYEGSIYFGCRHEHLPLELGYAAAMLQRDGHQVRLLDGQLQRLGNAELAKATVDFCPDFVVVTTAPTYLFWRCAPPELRIPADFLNALAANGFEGRTVAVGPHASATPSATLRKLGTDIVIRGECEEIILALASSEDWSSVSSTARLDDGELVVNGTNHASPFVEHPPLEWPEEWIGAHRHHHHRFDERNPAVPGAEVEASRGCPYNCSFCAKIDFRDGYRRRKLDLLLSEIDRLIDQGVGYIYFIDEIFLPQKALLEALADRNVRFGVQTRIDLWKPELLALLGKAGCVSIEAGLESLTVEGREMLAKRCRLDTEELVQLLITARGHVPFVQANLIGVPSDSPEMIAYWRQRLISSGIWANEPVPLYPYPSSPEYRKLWGEPDERAWERAHEHYLASFKNFSDLQDQAPLPLAVLEETCSST